MRDSDFKKLQAKWYAKLKASGFEDAEGKHGKLRQLPGDLRYYDVPVGSGEAELRRKAQVTQSRFEATRDYYSACSGWLHTGKFQTADHKRIWSYHCDGLKLAEIAKIFNFKSSSTIIHVIHRYETKFGIKRLRKTWKK